DTLTTGPFTGAFEAELANRTGAGHAICVSSGTAALHLAALCLNLEPGDVVVVPTITFLATANAACYVGADVVFADVDPDTGLMRPDDLLRALELANGRAKAVFPVHLAGQCVDMSGISEIARKHNLAIVEDASHALGASYRKGNKECLIGGCADSDMAVFSFHPVKTIAMGEGGAIMTNDGPRAERLARVRSHGMERSAAAFINEDMAFTENGDANPWYYEMQELGFNYRASDIHCALGSSQLDKLDDFVARRCHLTGLYDEALTALAPLVRPLGRVPDCDPAWHLYVALIDFEAAKVTRASLMGRLKDLGIGTQVHYIPVHKQPYYRNLGSPELPGAQEYYDKCLSLPLFPGMDDSDIGRVCDALASELMDNK
ncbi:MAG: UDP-4-amino-4,6-dideoxy-N-acetyl-beta-L-altrosamine transaminase, partial [Rhodospirillales bacterium]|nr:UDP-4-amino-4,6-dideoxy-N-acetyl-beta-L-altrosamine transaminase [Rhodospirillales bacterium]